MTTRAPDFRAPTNKGHTLGPEAFEDRLAVVLFFVGDLEDPVETKALWAYEALLPAFGERRVQLLGVARATPPELREAIPEHNVTVLADEDGSIRGAYGSEVATPFTVVIDRHGRVAEVIEGFDRDGADAHPPRVLERVDHLLAERPEDFEVRPGSSAGD